MVVKKKCVSSSKLKYVPKQLFFPQKRAKKKKNIERSVCKEKHNGYFSVLLGA